MGEVKKCLHLGNLDEHNQGTNDCNSYPPPVIMTWDTTLLL